MDKTTYIRDIEVKHEDGSIEELELHRSPTGGVFAIDFSFIDQVSEEVFDPFTGKKVVLGDSE